MYDLRAYINTVSGERRTLYAQTEQKTADGVNAVYISGISKLPINGDFGAGIEFMIPGMKRWMANIRHNEFWCSPVFGEKYEDIPDETQGFVYETENGEYGVILPVVSENYKCVLCGIKDGIAARLFSWYDKLFDIDALAFLYAQGNDPFELIRKCAKKAAELLNNGVRTREERQYPEILKYLGWCSWDAFAIGVTEDDILQKCGEFKEKNIPVRWIVLDDMWGYVKDFYGREYSTRGEMIELMYSSKLWSKDADPKRFPNGLKGVTDKVGELGIRVGIWFPATGYWRGIDPDGDAYKEIGDYLLCADNGMYVPDYKQQNAYMYYDYFNSFFRRSGAEFVKLDNQSMTRRFYKGKAPVGKIASGFHNAMEASVGQNFAGRMINCMGMSSEDIWNRSISPVLRCSDDFLPENREWFVKHIMQCAFNSMIYGELYYCDWDMWWTDDAQGVKNSILRAISGGPVYVSDKLGRSKSELLLPLVLDDGRVLMCDRPAAPAKDCIMEDPRNAGKIFKLQNICGYGGVIAAFDLDENGMAVKGAVSPSDIDGIKGERFAVYEHFSRELTVLDRNDSFDLTLYNADDFKLYIVVPIEDGFGVIGRTDKYISPKTVKKVSKTGIELFEDGELAIVADEKLLIKERY